LFLLDKHNSSGFSKSAAVRLFVHYAISPVAAASSLAAVMSSLSAVLSSTRLVWIRHKLQKLVNRMQKHTLSYANGQNPYEEIHKNA
jgi:hypothetical protein